MSSDKLIGAELPRLHSMADVLAFEATARRTPSASRRKARTRRCNLVQH